MKGSCLCGGIEYEVVRLDTPIQHCSCKTCRKAHAAAFNTAAGVLPEHFRWIKGEDMLNSFQSSPGKLRYFCSNCGSQLLAVKEGNPRIILRVATLDEDPAAQPEFQIWKSHEVPWLQYGENIAAHPEWQPGHG